MKLNGSEIIVECLKEQGVDTIFGYPGGAILNVYDALYKHSDEITHILTSHEQGASHAADGYARATGKVGVCFATSGPGATNLVTGIATAYMDSVPMVAITCNVTVPLLGRDSFQEIDIAGVTMPITKHSYIVKNVKDLAKTLRNAFRIAKEGRPGPVLVDVTKDVTAAECEYTPRVPKPVDRITASIKEEDIDKAWDDLGMKPGAAIGLCVRSVKICPGTTFCKRGLQDSVAIGSKLDGAFHGRNLPNKLKIGVSGCPNSCADSHTRDIGLIGGPKGWILYLGGRGGVIPRLGDRIAMNIPEERIFDVVEKVIDIYSENGQGRERLGNYIDRIGLDEFKKLLNIEEFLKA